MEAAQMVDTALHRAVRVCTGAEVAADLYGVERLRLSAWMYGGGMRGVADVASAAFVGAVPSSPT